MKSKIVKQFGAMLLAGTMIMTSGNVTTYAAEQTDESQEVDVNTESETEQDELYAESKSDEDTEVIQDEQNQELYLADMEDVEKIVEGDGYFICKEVLNGKEKYVAYILTYETKRDNNEILDEIIHYDYMKAGNVIAIATAKKVAEIDKGFLKKVKDSGLGLKIAARYYNAIEYYDIYAEKIDKADQDYSFKIAYNDEEKIIKEIDNEGIIGYSFKISDGKGESQDYENLFGKGEIGLHECLENDMYKKSLKKEDMRLYYYDKKRNRYILLEKGLNFSCQKVENNKNVDESCVELITSKINYYGTYLVCNNALLDSMVFNLTGLEKDGDSLLYYTNGLRDTSYTGLCDYDGTTYYVKDGTVDYNANMLYEYNGSTWNIKNGKVDTTESMTMNNGSLVYTNGGKTNNETTLCKYNGEWYYIHNGKVDYSATTLYKYNGLWWYIENGKVNFNKNGLCKYNGSWWYISGGKVNFNATGLCKYNGSWWYVSGGKVNFNATGLCKYNGTWWYVSGGKVNFNATGLCKYNGSWWYVSGGRVNFNATGLCKYNGTWWYVSGGKVNFNATGLCKYNGYWFYVENGAVRFKNTLCKYNGTWWYINNGVVNFSKTTLCKYGKNWFAVSKGKVAWNYTGYLSYNGKRYKIVKGVVKF